MQNYNSMLDFIKNKGGKLQENYPEILTEKANALTGDAKNLALWIINAHPDLPKVNPMEFDAKDNARNEGIIALIHAVPEGKTLWDMGNYDTLWEGFLPKKWEKSIKNAWNAMNSTQKANMLYVLAQEWVLHEFDIYEYLPFHGSYNPSSIFEYDILAVFAINNGDEKLLNQLKNVIQNNGETGDISASLLQLALKCNKPDLWEDIKNLLVVSQRQEGLRQAIVNAIRLSNVGAKIVLLQTILDHELCRFASVLTAMKQYILLPLADNLETNEKNMPRLLQLAIRFLGDKGENTEGVLSGENYTEIYMQLWALRQFNATKFWDECHKIMQNADVQKRAIVCYSTIYIRPRGFEFVKKYAATETDLAVRWNIFKSLENNPGDEKYDKTDGTWEFFEKLIAEIPESGLKNTKPQFTWEAYDFNPKWLFIHWAYRVARATRRSDEMLAYQDKFDGDLRSGIFCDHFREYFWAKDYPSTEYRPFSPNEFDRNWVLNAIQDKSATVYRSGFVLYNLLTPTKAELPILLGLLSRKSDDLRKSILAVLLKLNDDDLKASITTLLASKKEEQRLAALDLLQQLKQQNRLSDFVADSASLHKESTNVNGKSELILQDILHENYVIYDENNGFGLYNPKNRTEIPVLEKPTKGFFMDKMYGKPMFGLSISMEELEVQIKKLDALFVANESYEYEILNYENNKEKALISNAFFQRKKQFSYNPSYVESLANLPLPEVWEAWYKSSKLTPLDIYFLGLYSTSYPFNEGNIIPDWLGELVKNYTQNYTISIFQTNRLGLKYPNHCQNLIGYLYDEPAIKDQVLEIEIDITTHYFASIPTDKIHENMLLYTYMQEPSATCLDAFKAYFANFEQYQMVADDWKETRVEKMTDEQFKRVWALLYWFYRMLPPNRIGFNCCKEGTLGRAYQLGLVNYDEFCHLILTTEIWNNLTNNPRVDAQNTIKRYPIYQEFLAKAKPQFINIELKRGETPTPVSKFVINLSDIKGLDYFSKIIKGLGKDALQRGYSYTSYLGEDKTMQFSRMLKSCTPLMPSASSRNGVTVSETFEGFKTVLDDLKLSEKRLIQFALYAPQWLPWTAKYLNWNGLESAAWCLHAHAHNYFDMQKESELAKYTTVSAQDFQDGAVDIAWYKQAFSDLGETRFAVVYDAAHYISDNQGYIRARVYADAILGKLSLADCKKRITEKRNKDYIVALGLIPLVTVAADLSADILDRYKFIQEFKKSGKKVGQQRQESEKRVCDLAMENLARNTGYADPIRLTWAMETLDVTELLKRANAVNIDGTNVQLQVNSLGKADVLAIKGVKTLKDVPSALKKDPSVLELLDIKNSLNAQYSRIKKSLEEAMIRGDIFTLSEIENLQNHPVIKPLLNSLVLISDDKKIGFYGEKLLKNADGKTAKLQNSNQIKIAHCADLHDSGQWHLYQKQAFQQQIVQPFKQIFRELYIPNADELASVGVSNRYSGYQIQPTQAAGIFKSRGWAADYYEGVQKVYHNERLVVTIESYADWYSPYNTPMPTSINGIRFRQKNTNKSVALKDVPKAIFSEIMRDLDLVVSIAHVGGVDIEASLSSIELRAVIVEETAVLFGLNNVKIDKTHVFIKGKKGDYTVHLGSGIAHKVPSVMLTISPISTQERGRIFLPFVDEDPKTAEIVSKVLLLAKDDEIRDPSVLSQL
jgi:Family of unknown function (DUF5724)/Domain of unknown function (DUF4132)